MQNVLWMKGLVIVIIFLFIGTSSISGIPAERSPYNISSSVTKNIMKRSYDDFKLREKNSFSGKQSDSNDFVPGELLVKFRKNVKINVRIVNGTLTTGVTSVDLLNKKFKVTSADCVFKDTPDQSFSSWYILYFSKNSDVFRLADEYRDNSHVIDAEPNWVYHFSDDSTINNPGLGFLSTNPNDPLLNQQWALHNIDASDAWDVEKGDPNITIAIIDTGADYHHIDLAENIWNNVDEIPGNGIDDDRNGFIDDVIGWDFFNNDNIPEDDYGHGTHCAGIASAVTNNSIGVAGVCWNCKIMPVKIGGLTGFSIVNASEGLVYAADNGANIISMSWDGGSSELLKDALDYAYKKEVVLIAAAGNENNKGGIYPALYENVIAVAATNSNDSRADFSNFGSWVDVAAPGVDILSLRANCTNMSDGIVNEDYVIASGTSMACPCVAGLAALLLSHNKHCPYPVQMIQSMIPFTTDMIDADQYVGTGRINASKAVKQEPFVAILDSIPNWEDAKRTIDIQGAAWGETFQYYTIEYGAGTHPNTWMELITSYTPQRGVLATIDTTQLEEELYTIHLKVVCDHGSYTDKTCVYINNKADGSYAADIFVSNCYNDTTSGWGIDHFATIQDGVNHSKSGDTIFVYDGIYDEYILLESDSLTLIGQNKNWTILEGTIDIESSSDIQVSEFTIKCEDQTNYSLLGTILLFDSERCTISNTNITNRNFLSSGIYVYFSSYCTIEGNLISGMYSIFLGSNGIYARKSSHLNIIENTMMSHTDGIVLSGSDSCAVSKNRMAHCFFECIKLFNARKNLLSKNMLDNSSFGIVFMLTSSSNKIIGNTIINNFFGIYTYEGSRQYNNYIYYNNFMNEENAICNGFNIWYKPNTLFKGTGNFWSDYTGIDANGDGIGDTPYQVSRGNVDRYPLMQPYTS